MLQLKLVGVDTCRRYRRMRELVLTEAERAGIEIALVEETEVEEILKYGTVNLPLLLIGDTRIGQGNPPSRQALRKYLKEMT
jgi:hypothetical protein